MKKQLSIAIDGPAAAGKSTIAKRVARELNYVYIDTGAMYRALTYCAIQAACDPTDEAGLHSLLKTLDIQLRNGALEQEVLVNGTVVTGVIRAPEVTQAVSAVSQHKSIREEMVWRQKQLAQQGGVVMDGRDIGTEVMPHAEVKIFMTASVEERARRRYEENRAKGFFCDLEELKAEIAARDKADSERAVSPLRKADDAVVLDTSHCTIDEAVDRLLQIVQDRQSVLNGRI